MYGAAKDEGSFIYGTLYTEWMVKNNQSMVKQKIIKMISFTLSCFVLSCVDNISQSNYILLSDKGAKSEVKGSSGSKDAEAPRLLISVKNL